MSVLEKNVKRLWKPNTLFYNSVRSIVLGFKTCFLEGWLYLCLHYGYASENLFNRNVLSKISLLPFGKKNTVVEIIDRCFEWMICIDKKEGMIYPGNNKYLSEYFKMPPSVMCLSFSS